MPLILVQNETTVDAQYQHWKDIEGVQYHFPNQYKNKIEEGESFIYYRGSRRSNGLRGTPEYFGFGRIANKRIDPDSIGDRAKSQLHWFCDIVDYIPFPNPVPFKINNSYFENISSNQWSVAVRRIDEISFNRILDHAKMPGTLDDTIKWGRSLIAIDNVNPTLIDQGKSLIVPSTEEGKESAVAQVTSGGRFTKYSKIFGDRAEEIVFKVLTQKHEHQLRWVSKDGEKPGWDIEYYEDKYHTAVEVKGTSGKRFKNLEITAGEWSAAEMKRDRYNLYLVADCLSPNPIIQVINNPYELYLGKKISVIPTSYRMSFNVRIL